MTVLPAVRGADATTRRAPSRPITLLKTPGALAAAQKENKTAMLWPISTACQFFVFDVCSSSYFTDSRK